MDIKEYSTSPVDHLVLCNRWYKPYHKGAVIFFLVWISFNLLLWHPLFLAVVAGKYSVSAVISAIVTFIVIIPAPAYWMLTYLVNRTQVILSRTELQIYNGPLPSWRRNQSFPIKDIKYIRVEELAGQNEEQLTWNLSYDKTCHIKAVMRNGETIYILCDLLNPGEAQIALDRMGNWLQMIRKLRPQKDII